MDLRPVTITHETLDLQEAFVEFIPKVFSGIDFRRWRAAGGWDERYRAFGWLDATGTLVASASRQEMRVVLDGQPMRAWQLSAVGTLPEWRRRGLQQQSMHRLFDATPRDELMFLFGNETVVDFYPRFGFVRHREQFFRAPFSATPSQPRLRALDIDVEADRALLMRIAASAAPLTTGFGVRDHGRIVLWYWANVFPKQLHYTPEHDAIVVATQERDVLHVYDILAASPIELAPLVPRIAAAPVRELEFAFTPDRYWPSAKPHSENVEGPLFVRGPYRLPDGPFKFPKLGET